MDKKAIEGFLFMQVLMAIGVGLSSTGLIPYMNIGYGLLALTLPFVVPMWILLTWKDVHDLYTSNKSSKTIKEGK